MNDDDRTYRKAIQRELIRFAVYFILFGIAYVLWLSYL